MVTSWLLTRITWQNQSNSRVREVGLTYSGRNFKVHGMHAGKRITTAIFFICKPFAKASTCNNSFPSRGTTGHFPGSCSDSCLCFRPVMRSFVSVPRSHLSELPEASKILTATLTQLAFLWLLSPALLVAHSLSRRLPWTWVGGVMLHSVTQVSDSKGMHQSCSVCMLLCYLNERLCGKCGPAPRISMDSRGLFKKELWGLLELNFMCPWTRPHTQIPNHMSS